MYMENINVPAANFEWMMTDQCGSTSVSITPNVPQMALDPGASFRAANVPQVSLFQGNAAYFPGNGSVGARSKSSTMFAVDISNGFTIFAWLYACKTSTQFPLGEFGTDVGGVYTVGLQLWMYRGGLYYDGEHHLLIYLRYIFTCAHFFELGFLLLFYS
jgi:hypothetical protein